MTTKRFGIIAALILVVVGALVSNASAGATLRVPEKYLTIQEAVDAAQSGDTVLVSPGTYAGVTIADKQVVLASLGGVIRTFCHQRQSSRFSMSVIAHMLIYRHRGLFLC